MLRLQDTEDARQHLQELARARKQLRGVSVDIGDVLYKLLKLRSLSSRVRSLTSALETQLDSLFIASLQA